MHCGLIVMKYHPSLKIRDLKIFETLRVVSEDLDHGKRKKKYRLAAAVVQRGKIVGIGTNDYKKTHPLQARYALDIQDLYPCGEIKAIANAIRRLGNERLLKGTSVYVYRTKYTDCDKTRSVAGLAKPCESCQTHFIKFGIERMYYSTEEGFVCEEV